jgi:hypothetical protein
MARPGGSTVSRTLAVAAVAVLAVAAVGLSLLALQRGNSDTVSPTAATPAPAFSFGGRESAAPEPTPSHTLVPAPIAASPGEERFLAANGDEVWRATAGTCSGASPVVERSADGGETWATLTPPDLTQVLALATFGVAQGEIVGAAGADCTRNVLRTYTAGLAWESYPQALGDATYVDPADRGSIVVADAAVPAPCADARNVRSSRGVVGAICHGTAYALLDGAWSELASEALALDAVSGTIAVAHISDACAGGAAVTRFVGTSPETLGCIGGVDPSAPAALSVLGDETVLWTGDMLLRLPS